MRSSNVTVALSLVLVGWSAAAADLDVLPGIFRSLVGGRLLDSDSATVGILDELLLNTIPFILGQRPCNENGTFSAYKRFALNDHSNDDIARTSTLEIIARSGFRSESHEVLTDDGYVTQLIRLVNPLVERAHLRRPPVVLLHGALADPSQFVYASAGQHRPERWPRQPNSDPMRSWNRSVAFALANRGYDVWMPVARGADLASMGRSFVQPIRSALGGPSAPTQALGQRLLSLLSAPSYWTFTMDQLIEIEFPNQINRVLQLTGASNVTLLGYSLSAMGGLAMLGTNADMAAKVHSFVAVAPPLSVEGTNALMSQAIRRLIPMIPDEKAALVPLAGAPISELLLLLGSSPALRYTISKFFEIFLAGSSAKYRSLLEPAVVGHMMRPISMLQVKHFAQILARGSYAKYDFGLALNPLVYGQLTPPDYSIADIKVRRWLLVSASNDNLATPSSIGKLLEKVNPKPAKHIDLRGYNHLNFVQAVDNDVQIVLPLIEFLDENELT